VPQEKEANGNDFQLKAVVVDDAPLMRQILRTILEKRSFEVIGEAGDGHEAIEVVGKTRPHLVTMDITMPVMDGLESLKIIKRDFPETQVVVVSAFGERANILEAIRLGASNFIVKPFDEPKVIRVINSVKF
jgi:two-component system chemotaxis response regulator CheY